MTVPHRVSRRFRWVRIASASALALLLVSCASPKGGTSLGELRGVARRVKGGGAECPLALDVSRAMHAIGFDGVVVADQRNPAHASDGLIGADDTGSELASVGGVRVSCRFLFAGQRLTVVVVGVDRGHALSTALGDLRQLGGVSDAEAAAFVNLMVDRRAADPQMLGSAHLAAVAKVATSDGSDQAVIVAVSPPPTSGGAPAAPLDASAVVSGDEHLRSLTAALAEDLAS